MNSNKVHLVLVVVGAVFSFLPLFTKEISNVDTVFTNATTVRAAPSYIGLVHVALAVAGILLLDLLCDVAARSLSSTHATATRKREARGADSVILNDAEKLVFLVGLVLTPVVTLCGSDGSNGDGRGAFVLTLVCAIRCQIVLVGGACVASLARYNPRHFPPWLAGIVVVAVGVVGGTGGYVYNRTAGCVHPSCRLSFSCTHAHAC